MGRSLDIGRTLPQAPAEVWASLNRGRDERFVGAGLLEGVRGWVSEDEGRRVVTLDDGGTLEIELLDAFGDTRLTLHGEGLPARLLEALSRRLQPESRRGLGATATATGVLAMGLAGVLSLASARAPEGPVVVERLGAGQVPAVLHEPVVVPVTGEVTGLQASAGGWLAVERAHGPPVMVDLQTLAVHEVPVDGPRDVRWIEGGGLVVTGGEGVQLLREGHLVTLSETASEALPHPDGGWILAEDTALVWRHDGVAERLVSWSGPIRPLGVEGDRVWYEATWAGQPTVGWVDATGARGTLQANARPLFAPTIGAGGAVWVEASGTLHRLFHHDGRSVPGVSPQQAPPAMSPDGRWVGWPEHGLIRLWNVASSEVVTYQPEPWQPIRQVALAKLHDELVVCWVTADGLVRAWRIPHGS